MCAAAGRLLPPRVSPGRGSTNAGCPPAAAAAAAAAAPSAARPHPPPQWVMAQGSPTLGSHGAGHPCLAAPSHHPLDHRTPWWLPSLQGGGQPPVSPHHQVGAQGAGTWAAAPLETPPGEAGAGCHPGAARDHVPGPHPGHAPPGHHPHHCSLERYGWPRLALHNRGHAPCPLGGTQGSQRGRVSGRATPPQIDCHRHEQGTGRT